MEENKVQVVFPDTQSYKRVLNIILEEISTQNGVLNDTSDHSERIPIMEELVILKDLETILRSTVETNTLLVSKDNLENILNTYTNLFDGDFAEDTLEDYLLMKDIFDNWPEYIYPGPTVDEVFDKDYMAKYTRNSCADLENYFEYLVGLSNKIGELISREELTNLVNCLDGGCEDEIYAALVAKLRNKYPEESNNYQGLITNRGLQR